MDWLRRTHTCLFVRLIVAWFLAKVNVLDVNRPALDAQRLIQLQHGDVCELQQPRDHIQRVLGGGIVAGGLLLKNESYITRS